MTTPSHEALKEVLAKAASDAGFRAQILANPDAAGIHLPAGTTFTEHLEKADPNAILLPPVSGDSGEITEAELQDVAGGWDNPQDNPRYTNDLRKPECAP